MAILFRPKKAAVIGTGNMGSQIACMLANNEINVLLLEKPGNGQNDAALQNRAKERLENAINRVPPPLIDPHFKRNIKTGLLNQHLDDLPGCDWIIESISEDLPSKIELFKSLENHINEKAIITTNTSSISINEICEPFEKGFKNRFLGIHFFNPVRYIPIIEIIPGMDTDPEIVKSVDHFLDTVTGKTTILCKDTPAFIANRIGIYSFLVTLQATLDLGLTIEEADMLTGKILGRPKSGTFPAADMIGIDIILAVAKQVPHKTSDKHFNKVSTAIEFLEAMVQRNLLGEKTDGGFYKREGEGNLKKKTSVVDLYKYNYTKRKKVKNKVIPKARKYKDLSDRIEYLLSIKGKEGEFYRKIWFGIYEYISHVIPDITSELYKVDDILKITYGWETGIFELWEQMGIKNLAGVMGKYGYETASWTQDLVNSDANSLYKIIDNEKYYYDVLKNKFLQIPGLRNFILLDVIRDKNTIWHNEGASLIDLGDGVLILEFHTKMNIIDTNILEGINVGLEKAEKNYQALIIGNEGAHFSVGVNLGLLFMMAIEKDYKQINEAISEFQNTVLKIRYASIPVLSTPHGLTLGGGTEISLHCDSIHSTTETYMGLVEIKAGLLPAGGGTKELTAKLSQNLKSDNLKSIATHLFDTIIFGKVSNSAREAKTIRLMEQEDPITPNPRRLLADAKQTALQIIKDYTPPARDRMIAVGGTPVMDIFHNHIEQLQREEKISSYDSMIAREVAKIMSGGETAQVSRDIPEQTLLDLEREAFLSLTGRRGTLERIYKIIGRK